MTKKEQQIMSNKWLLVIKEYEDIKNKTSKHLKTVNELCDIFAVHREAGSLLYKCD